jgi:poly-gamma-glutamate synthesis protein (capsule biosynthesis protein)
MIRILVGGDICPMGRIQNAFIKGNAHEIFHDLTEEIASADLSIVNLECPLVSQETPIAKAGPVLGSSIKCIKGFAAAKWNVLNLANNHSYDHGAEGLRGTIQSIKSAGLNVVGAGLNIEEAQVPYITQIDNRRIVIYSMAEHEFSVADECAPGANPLDLINFVNAIRLYKQQNIFIVLIHGGKEFYPYPTPEMVKRCRFMIDMGADAVICCHTHCPLPWELHAGQPIVYGLGNLIFEAIRKQPDAWHEGYLAVLTFDNGQVLLETIPYLQSKGFLGAKKMYGPERRQFFDEMQKRGAQIKDKIYLSDRWTKYCRGQRENYLTSLFGYNRFMRKMQKTLLPILHPKEKLLKALHLVQCETHQEILATIFREEKRGEHEDKQ